MSDLLTAVQALVGYHRQSPALLVQKPDGDYHVSPNGYGDGLENRFVISRYQIRELMMEESITVDRMSDPDTAERLVKLVREFHLERTRLG